MVQHRRQPRVTQLIMWTSCEMDHVIELRQDAFCSGPGLHALILLPVRMHDQCHETTLGAEASRNARVARKCNNACTLEANAD
jgi:hypothetical protein